MSTGERVTAEAEALLSAQTLTTRAVAPSSKAQVYAILAVADSINRLAQSVESLTATLKR